MVPLPGGAAKVQWRRSSRARRVSLRIDPRDGAVVVQSSDQVSIGDNALID